MADTVVDVPGVGVVAFPEGMSQAAIAVQAKNMMMKSSVGDQSSIGGALMQGASKAVPLISDATSAIATSPTLPKTAATIGRVVGGLSPIVSGAASGAALGGLPGGVLGAVTGATAAARGAWAGGKTGWFTAKLGQSLANPTAQVLDAVKPYASEILNKASGIQGGLDLAQMDDPKRKDIGFLGLGVNTSEPPMDPDAVIAARDQFLERIKTEDAARQERMDKIKRYAEQMPEKMKHGFLAMFGLQP